MRFWAQHYRRSLPSIRFVFVRAKRVGRRRYLYLVEGKREGGSIKQKTLCYLGPLSRLVAGVPEEVKGMSPQSSYTW